MILLIICIIGFFFNGYLAFDYGLRGGKYSKYTAIGAIGFVLFFWCILGMIYSIRAIWVT